MHIEYLTHWYLHNIIKFELCTLSLLCLYIFDDLLFVILRKMYKLLRWTLKTIEALICLILTSTYCLATIGSSYVKLFFFSSPLSF